MRRANRFQAFDYLTVALVSDAYVEAVEKVHDEKYLRG
jgi:hypothetical protein